MKQHREDAIFHEVTTTSCAAKALAVYSREQKMDTRAVKAFGGQTGVYFVTATRKTHAVRERMKLRPWQIYAIVSLRDIITSKLVVLHHYAKASLGKLSRAACVSHHVMARSKKEITLRGRG